MKKPKSKFRKLHILIRKKKVDSLLWMLHFGEGMKDPFPTCSDCADFKAGVCSGGWDPIPCMVKQSKSSWRSF